MKPTVRPSLRGATIVLLVLNGLSPGLSGAEPPAGSALPAALATAPRADADDDKLTRLRKAKCAAAVEELRLRYAAYQSGQAPVLAVFEASRRVLDAQLALAAGPEDRLRVLEAGVQLARDAEKTQEQLVKSGKGSTADVALARCVRLAAEIALAEAAPVASGKHRCCGTVVQAAKVCCPPAGCCAKCSHAAAEKKGCCAAATVSAARCCAGPEKKRDDARGAMPIEKGRHHDTPVESTRDEVELLTAELAVRAATTAEAAVQLNIAREHLDRLEAAKEAVTGRAVTEARGRVETIEARLRVCRAEQELASVRLKQAQRRLDRLQGEKPLAKQDHADWWCAEHGVPEDVCGMCNVKYAAECKKKGDWCAKHNRPDSQCFICHPEHKQKFAKQFEAKYGRKPPEPHEESDGSKDKK